MLKRLKRKFLTMTMGLISLVLIVVFVSLLISTYTQQRRQIDMSLNQAVGQGFGLEAPKERFGRRDDPGGNFMTAISILADSDGNVILSNSDSVEISDDDLTDCDKRRDCVGRRQRASERAGAVLYAREDFPRPAVRAGRTAPTTCFLHPMMRAALHRTTQAESRLTSQMALLIMRRQAMTHRPCRRATI